MYIKIVKNIRRCQVCTAAAAANPKKVIHEDRASNQFFFLLSSVVVLSPLASRNPVIFLDRKKQPVNTSFLYLLFFLPRTKIAFASI